MELKELMAAFCGKAGIEPIEPDENGVYALSADATDFSVVAADERGERALLVAAIGSKPENEAGRIAEILLGVNYLFSATKGSTVAFNAATEQYVLQRELSIVGLSVDEFVSVLDGFVDSANELHALLGPGGALLSLLSAGQGGGVDDGGRPVTGDDPFSRNYI